MPSSCPDCGAEMEFQSQSARLLSGTCPDCGKASMVLEGIEPGTRAPVGAPEAGEAAAAAVVGPSADANAPVCAECGGPLTIRSVGDSGLEASCRGCSTTVSYVVSRPSAGPERVERTFRKPFDGSARPASRPCRECGGPLRFTTGDDGLVMGECSSCGNRFTLPPRREDNRRGGLAPRRGGGFGRGPPGAGSRPRSRGGWSPPRGGDRPSSYRRRAPRRDDDEESEDRPRRRRD